MAGKPGFKQVVCPKGHYYSIGGRTGNGSCLICYKIYQKTYRRKNKQRLAKLEKEHRDTHKQECLEYKRKYRKEHPEVHRLSNAKREIKRNLRTPKFGQRGIKTFVKKCPKSKTVDHYIPLLGDFVSGLNVIWNLQYLTRSANSSKNNKCNLLEASEWYGKLLEKARLK